MVKFATYVISDDTLHGYYIYLKHATALCQMINSDLHSKVTTV